MPDNEGLPSVAEDLGAETGIDDSAVPAGKALTMEPNEDLAASNDNTCYFAEDIYRYAGNSICIFKANFKEVKPYWNTLPDILSPECDLTEIITATTGTSCMASAFLENVNWANAAVPCLWKKISEIPAEWGKHEGQYTLAMFQNGFRAFNTPGMTIEDWKESVLSPTHTTTLFEITLLTLIMDVSTSLYTIQEDNAGHYKRVMTLGNSIDRRHILFDGEYFVELKVELPFGQQIHTDVMFEVKPSTIPHTGLGVFANVRVEKFGVIGFYNGVYKPNEEGCEVDEMDAVAEYVLSLVCGSLDASAGDHFTRFVQDSYRWSIPNAHFTRNGKLIALSRIEQNEEIFVSYGPIFWSESFETYMMTTDSVNFYEKCTIFDEGELQAATGEHSELSVTVFLINGDGAAAALCTVGGIRSCSRNLRGLKKMVLLLKEFPKWSGRDGLLDDFKKYLLDKGYVFKQAKAFQPVTFVPCKRKIGSLSQAVKNTEKVNPQSGMDALTCRNLLNKVFDDHWMCANLDRRIHCHFKVVDDFDEVISKFTVDPNTKWNRIEDPYHPLEESTMEQRECVIVPTDLFKGHAIITKILRRKTGGRNEVLHTDVDMQIANDYNLFVLIGNMSHDDNYVLIVGNQIVTLQNNQAIIMKASVYHAGSGVAAQKGLYILYSHTKLNARALSKIKTSAQNSRYLPHTTDVPQYTGNFADATEPDIIDTSDALYVQLMAPEIVGDVE